MTLGERIKERREEMGISGAELARRIEVTSSYIYQLERDTKIMPTPTLKASAAARGCTALDLDPDLGKQAADSQ